MTDKALAKPYEPTTREMTEETAPLKKWEKPVKRDSNGRFVRGSTPLPHAHRKKGSLNRTTVELKQAILGALEAAGGPGGSVAYLTRLATDNSSAFASLLKSVLPTTLASESNGGAGLVMTFRREIVWPDGRTEIEGQTPKSLPAPAGVGKNSSE
jgi:hypothetical protein